MKETPVERWEAYILNRDPEQLHQTLHPDCIFESPILHTPKHGREVALAYLAAGVDLLGRPGFRYVEKWQGPSSAALEFRTDLDGIDIYGVDIFSWSPDDMRIKRFKVMLRPLKAIQAVHRLMAEKLASPGETSRVA